VVYLAVALGGALGAVLRWALGDAVPDGAGFPWTTFVINVTGSLVLAWLPAIGAVRRRQILATALGPGLLGGYTTLSAYSEQARVLLADGQTTTALLYLLGTLATCLVAVAAVSRLYPPAAGDEFAAEGGDE
jgi:fluoride exporter